MPDYDVTIDHAIRVLAPAPYAYAAMRAVDLEGSLVVRALFTVRAIVMGAEPSRRGASRGTIEALEAIGWRIADEEAGHGFTLAAVTQPWQPRPKFLGMSRDEFTRFDAPGYAKIALDMRVDPVDPYTSIVRTETRVRTTDPRSRSKFRAYWSLLSPGVELIRLDLLRRVKCAAERAYRQATE